MNASKEQGRKALQNLNIISNCMDNRADAQEEFLDVQKFLDAAIRKLPSEKAFIKDKSRKVKVK